MNIMQVYTLYFSPTGSTEKVAKAMGEKLAAAFDTTMIEINFTKPENREEIWEFGSEDLLIVASPTYAGKLPNKILPDFKAKIKGNDAMAVPVVTYGNRSYDNSLAELCETLAVSGFHIVAASTFAARHAFSDQLAGDRPSKADLKMAAYFAGRVAEKIKEASDYPAHVPVPGAADAPYYVPKGVDGQPAKFLKATPKVNPGLCDGCGVCVELCPVGSISAANVSEYTGPCIKCQACIRGCHAKARYMDDQAFLSHVAMLEQNFASAVRSNEFYI